MMTGQRAPLRLCVDYTLVNRIVVQHVLFGCAVRCWLFFLFIMSEEFFTFDSEAHLKEWQKQHGLRLRTSRRNLDGFKKLYFSCARYRTNPWRWLALL